MRYSTTETSASSSCYSSREDSCWQPIHQGRFGEKRFAIHAWYDPIARLHHFTCRCGVSYAQIGPSPELKHQERPQLFGMVSNTLEVATQERRNVYRVKDPLPLQATWLKQVDCQIS